MKTNQRSLGTIPWQFWSNAESIPAQHPPVAVANSRRCCICSHQWRFSLCPRQRQCAPVPPGCRPWGTWTAARCDQSPRRSCPQCPGRSQWICNKADSADSFAESIVCPFRSGRHWIDSDYPTVRRRRATATSSTCSRIWGRMREKLCSCRFRCGVRTAIASLSNPNGNRCRSRGICKFDFSGCWQEYWSGEIAWFVTHPARFADTALIRYSDGRVKSTMVDKLSSGKWRCLNV